MLLDQVSNTQMRAAAMLGGATIVLFFAARMYPGKTQAIRLLVTCVYIAGLLGFLLYFLL